MIRKITSDLPTFKTLELHSGLNVLIAKKEQDATDRQTRNRAGKTSIVEIIHFLTGGNAKTDSIFRSESLREFTFEMSFDVGPHVVSVKRSGSAPSKLVSTVGEMNVGEWCAYLGERLFLLNRIPATYEARKPTFRSLFSYFVRRQNSGAFVLPVKQATMQQAADWQTALTYLFGLDWKISSDWQKVRDREKTLRELRRAAGAGALGAVIGTSASLRTQLTVAESKLGQLNARISEYKVLPQYNELEQEADDLTAKINELSNDNVVDLASIRDLEIAIESEEAPPMNDLQAVYQEAGVVLPEMALKRYDEVRSFHESVVRNRKNYLNEELTAAQLRVTQRERERAGLDARRAEVMSMLNSHGALDQFARLQEEAARMTAEIESLRQRYEAADQLENNKAELEIERKRLNMRLKRDFEEQNDQLRKAILAYENISSHLYESAGSMEVKDTANGPEFAFPMQGSESKGIKNMQIFCFDMMLMQLCAQHGMGPHFLVHDSHLFDGVDGRQVISALKIGAELAAKIGFQYIVTMNEDDVFKETIDGFDVRKYILPTELTDATETGGLFGIRF